MSKSTSKSKTIWLNLITFVINIVAWINADAMLAIGISEEAVPTILAGLGTVTAGLNLIIRRYFTTEALK
jgi:hypothetical protein